MGKPFCNFYRLFKFLYNFDEIWHLSFIARSQERIVRISRLGNKFVYSNNFIYFRNIFWILANKVCRRRYLGLPRISINNQILPLSFSFHSFLMLFIFLLQRLPYKIEIELGCDGDTYGRLMNYSSEGHGFKSQTKQGLFTVLSFNSKNVCCKVMIGNLLILKNKVA